jgi:hypothetical protein
MIAQFAGFLWSVKVMKPWQCFKNVDKRGNVSSGMLLSRITALLSSAWHASSISMQHHHFLGLTL